LHKETALKISTHRVSKNKEILPITEFPDPKAHLQAHSAGTVKFARPHCDSTY